MNLSKFNKISIIGPPGSGKSTLAIKLGEIFDLPVHHIDCYFWKPDWIMEDKETVYSQIKEITKNEKWIIDGNYIGTIENRCEQSDVILLLDFATKFCEKSVIKRHKTKEYRVGLPKYLRYENEKLEEILQSIRGWHTRRDAQIIPIFKKYQEKTITLNTRKQVNDFVKKLTKSIEH